MSPAVLPVAVAIAITVRLVVLELLAALEERVGALEVARESAEAVDQ